MDVASLNQGRFHAQRLALFKKGIKSGALSMIEINHAIPDEPGNEDIRVLLIQSIRASGIKIVEGNMVRPTSKLQVLLVGGYTDIKQNLERNMKKLNAPFEFSDHWAVDKSKSTPYRAIPKGVHAVILLHEFVSHNASISVRDACKDQNVRLISTRHQWIQFRQLCHQYGLWTNSNMYPGIVPMPAIGVNVQTIVEAKSEKIESKYLDLDRKKPIVIPLPEDTEIEEDPIEGKETMTEEKIEEKKDIPVAVPGVKGFPRSKLSDEKYAEREAFVVERIKAGDGPFRIGRECKLKYDTLMSAVQIRSIAKRHNLTVANQGNPRIGTTNPERLLSVPVNVPRDAEIKVNVVQSNNAEADFKAALELLKPAMIAMKVRSITAYFEGDKLKTKIERVQEDSFDV